MAIKTKIAATGINKHFLSIALLSVAVSAPWISAGVAEGLTAQFTLGQRLSYSDETGVAAANADEGFRTRTDLGVVISSETRTQSLSFAANAGLTYRFSDNGASDRTEIEDPNARLSYKVESRNTELSFDARYLRTDVDNSALTDPVTGADIETGDGARETYNLNTQAIIGREGPLTLTLGHGIGEINYSGTTDPTLVDTKTQNFNARFDFEINQTTSVNVFSNWSEQDAAGPGANDRTNTNSGVGLSYQISPLLSATAQLSYQKIETDNNAGAVTDTSGVGYSLGLTREAANGALTFRFNEDETVNGKRRQLRVGRSYEVKRGTIGFSLGMTKTDGLSARPIASLNADLQIDKRSSFMASLDQSSTVSNDNLTTINSRLSLNYVRELSALSSMSAGIQVIDRNVQSAGGADQTSMRLNLEHRYQLGSDWDLVSGYSYTKTTRDTQADRKTTSLFMGLQKSFDVRP